MAICCINSLMDDIYKSLKGVKGNELTSKTFEKIENCYGMYWCLKTYVNGAGLLKILELVVTNEHKGSRRLRLSIQIPYSWYCVPHAV